MKTTTINKMQIQEKYNNFVDILFPNELGNENILFFDELLYKYSVPIPNLGVTVDNAIDMISDCLSNPTLLLITLQKIPYGVIFEIYARTLLFAQFLNMQDQSFTMEYKTDRELFITMFSHYWNQNGVEVDKSFH